MNLEQLDEKIKVIERLVNSLRDYRQEEYNACPSGLGYVTPDPYLIEKELSKLKTLREEMDYIGNVGVELGKEYYLNDNIYFTISEFDNHLNFRFHIKDDDWIYDNFIESWSGINEWINKTIIEMYDLYSRNSEYNYAFGTCSLSSHIRTIENEEFKYNSVEVANCCKDVVDFFTDKENETVKAINNSLDNMFENMKKIIVEE